MRIVLDVMGGDNAPDATIKGAVKAIKEIESEIVLVGNEEIINKKIREFYGKDSIKEISERLMKAKDFRLIVKYGKTFGKHGKATLDLL